MRLRSRILAGIAGATLTLGVLATIAPSAFASPATDQVEEVTGMSPITSPTVSNSTEELVVAYVGVIGTTGDGSAQQETISDPAGNMAWHRIGQENSQLGDAEIWFAFTPAANFTVKATALHAHSGYLNVVTYTGANSLVDPATNDSADGTPSVTVIGEETGDAVGMVVQDESNPSTAPTATTGQAVYNSYLSGGGGGSAWSQRGGTVTDGSNITESDSAPTGQVFNAVAVEISTLPYIPD